MTVLITTTVLATEVLRGDNVQTRRGGYAAVDAITVGRKWVTGKDVAGKLLFEVPVGESVEVTREVPTDEEKAAKQAERDAERLEFKIEGVLKWLRARSEAVLSLDAVELLSSFTLESSLQIAGEKALAIEVLGLLAHNSDQPVLEVIGQFIERETSFQMRHGSRVLSRSTSVTSNLIEDVRRGVFFNFAEEFNHGWLYAI